MIKKFDTFETKNSNLFENEPLFEEDGDSLSVYPYNIENDINNKLKINISYDTMSNSEMKLFFYLNDNVSFDKLRNIKKYFLYHIPHCINIEYDNHYLSIIFTRKFGLDALKTYF